MDDDELRALLARVQTGELTPDEAAARLQGEDAQGPEEPARRQQQQEEQGPRDGGAPPRDDRTVRLVRLRSTANRTRVVGDPTVRTIRVEGRHRLRFEGDEVHVENEVADELFGEGGRHLRIDARSGRGLRFQGIHGIQGLRGGDVLEVRVNPALPLDFDCDAGMIEVLGVDGALTGRVNAGSAVIEGFTGPIDLAVNAGKLRARGRIDHGESAIDVNVGKADVLLEPGSSVRIVKTATLGSAEVDEDVVGAGSATLRITCSLGAVRVHSPEGSTSTRHRAG